MHADRCKNYNSVEWRFLINHCMLNQPVNAIYQMAEIKSNMKKHQYSNCDIIAHRSRYIKLKDFTLMRWRH